MTMIGRRPRTSSTSPVARGPVSAVAPHGHHPVRDLFFTSVARTVLKQMPVPELAGA